MGRELTLLRIGAGAPTAEQIKYAYDTEKHLFTAGAKFKTSALDIQAVDYDDTTGELTEVSSKWLHKAKRTCRDRIRHNSRFECIG